MDRKSIKEAAKIAFKRNYWMCVLVAFILSIALGTSYNYSSISNAISNNDNDTEVVDTYDFDIDEDEVIKSTDAGDNNYIEDSSNTISSKAYSTIGILVIIFLIIFVLVILLISLCINIFAFMPLEVGCQKFFMNNKDTKANINELGYGFKSCRYKSIILTKLLKNIYVFLWSLLFIIPGIIKSYEYYFVSYILAETDGLSYKEALEMSKKLTDGNKWNLFVFDLSFILWELLGICTLGIVNIFWVNPYKFQSRANLYYKIKEIHE